MPKSTNREDYQEISQPVGAMPKEYPPGHVSIRHSHRRAQLVHAVAGVMEVEADGRIWIVPPGRALWLPPAIPHQTRMRGRVSLRTLYIEPAHSPANAPISPRFVQVSPLLRELVERACVLPIAYETSERARLIMDLLLKELDWSDGLSLPLLRVGDRRLQSIVDGILANPGGHNSLTGWARHVGASPRTIARSCRRELGMPFVQVRRHLRLQAALPRIADGEPITAVALDVGYDTAAAFSSAFTRCLGMPPSQFFEKYSDKAVQPQLATIRRANL